VTEEPTEQAHSAMPFTRLVGVRIRSMSRDEVVGSLDWSPERCTAGGAMHGGALMSLADATGAMLAFANLPDDASGTTTITSTTNFLRGVTSGAVVATSRLVHRGRTTIVVETDLRGTDDKLVGRVTQTQAVLR
jgi:1,4-dihydroxy-2-naphthoyl-CoA hydrolase